MGEQLHEELAKMLDRAIRREHGDPEPCDLEADPLTDDPWDLDNPWHHLRVCLHCGGYWWGLHCPHDGRQNPCAHCGERPATLQTECFDLEDLSLDALDQPHDDAEEPQPNERARQDDKRQLEAERERAAPGGAVMPAHANTEDRAQQQDPEQEHGHLQRASDGIITRDGAGSSE